MECSKFIQIHGVYYFFCDIKFISLCDLPPVPYDHIASEDVILTLGMLSNISLSNFFRIININISYITLWIPTYNRATILGHRPSVNYFRDLLIRPQEYTDNLCHEAQSRINRVSNFETLFRIHGIWIKIRNTIKLQCKCQNGKKEGENN